MADIAITLQDRVDAEKLIEAFLVDKMGSSDEDADFSKGSALRDLTVGALANIFAYFRYERDLIRARQSLLLLEKLNGVEDIDDAVDEILSNWFISRKKGTFARGVVTIYLNADQPFAVPRDARFFKTSSLSFVPDTSASYVSFGTDDLSPRADASGEIVGYTAQLLLIATEEGDDYNVEAGSFVDWTAFSPYVVRVENASPFTGGAGTETTAELLERSDTAVSVRDLNSARSIDATLKNEFADVEDVTVIGYGDSEMIRDLVIEQATNTRIHAGGYVDSFLRSPITEQKTYTGTIGGEFTDPRPEILILRDDTVDDFESAGVSVGDVIVIYNAVTSSEPDKYIVNEVSKYGIYVSQRNPFPLLLPTRETYGDDGVLTVSGAERRFSSSAYEFTSDDVGKYIRVTDASNATNIGTWKISGVNASPNYALLQNAAAMVDETALPWDLDLRVVDYSIGSNPPSFDNHVSRRITGQFTKTVQNDGRILLPAEPIYYIRDVSFASSSYPAAITIDGRVTFPNRVNSEPSYQTLANDLEYQVLCHNPEAAQSGWQVTEVDVGWPDGALPNEQKDYFNNNSLRVTYDSLTGYDTVWSFMTAGNRRILCGSVIPRGFHPVYLSMTINYRLSRRATEALDTEEAADSLVNFINTFDTQEDMDTSDIVAHLRENFPVIGYIEPPVIDYNLYAPDGRLIPYQTEDEVTVDASKQTGTNPEDQLSDPLSQGVSDNTVRYLTVADLITFTELTT